MEKRDTRNVSFAVVNICFLISCFFNYCLEVSLEFATREESFENSEGENGSIDNGKS